MKKMIIAVAMSLSSSFATAGSVAGFGGSTEITQLANNAQLMASYIEHVQQTTTQLSQYATMLRNLKNLTPSSALQLASQKLWADQNMNQTFKNLFTIVRSGEKAAYGAQALDQQLKSQYPAYGASLNGFDLQNAYKTWFGDTRNAINAGLSMTQTYAEDLNSESDLMNQLSTMSGSVDGQVQAISAGNQIGIAMVGQLQKLRALQISQNQVTQTAMNNQLNSSQASKDFMGQLHGGNGCTRIRTPDQIASGASC